MSILPFVRRLALVLIMTGAWAPTPPLFGATSALPLPLPAAAPASTDELTVESVGAKRAALKKEIAATREEFSKPAAGTSDDAARWLTQETALLERIDAIHAEQQRTLQHAADLAKEAAEVDDRIRNQRPPEATFKPPFGMALLNQVYAERDYLEQATVWLKTDVANTAGMLQEARETLEEKERARRAVRQAVEAGKDAAKSPGNLRLAELENRLAQETVLLREKALKTLKFQQSLLEPKLKLLRPRLDWLRAHLVLGVGPEVSSTGAAELQKRTTELDRAIAVAKKDADAVTQIVIVTEPRSGNDKASEELESRRADRQTANLTLSVLTAQRERLAENARVTELRRRVLSGAMPAAEMRTVAAENRDAIDELTRDRKREALDLFKSRKELQEWQSRLTHAAGTEEKVAAWGLERMKRLAAWIELSADEVADLDRLRTERSRLQEEIGTRVNLFSLRDGTAVLRENVVAAWNYEVFSVKDEPVRVKTMLAVLLLVVLGYYAARWTSALLSRTAFKRMNPGRRAAWQTLWFYGLFIVVLVVAFDLFHISLTQFSVVSGALAVGLGFGSQNLIGNFISGIILLIERPVNQGDVIEIDGRQVTVEDLGPRSTIVRTADNTHMIVPNSRLLEQPVTNWTLSDDVIRKHIRLGVAYDSSTRRVAELLQGILDAVETVRKEPKPVVKFADFGENSLIFEIYFWVSISDPVDAENELRHRIAETFAKEAIVMALPQRDVHLSTSKPLQVVIAPPAVAEREGKAAAVPPEKDRPRSLG